jgi:hypothetical protein
MQGRVADGATLLGCANDLGSQSALPGCLNETMTDVDAPALLRACMATYMHVWQHACTYGDMHAKALCSNAHGEHYTFDRRLQSLLQGL